MVPSINLLLFLLLRIRAACSAFEVGEDARGLLGKRHVVGVVDAVECAGRCFEGANSASKSSGRGPASATSSKVLRIAASEVEAADQDLRDLAARR